jgi:hypothetical protein
MAGRHRHYTVREVEAALRKAAGIVSGAAQILNCTPQTVRNYLQRYDKLRIAIDEQIEVNLDVAETKLLTAIGEGVDWAVRFYLETKGKHRGYTRRQEITQGGPIIIEVTDARERLLFELDQMAERIGSVDGGALGPDGPGSSPRPPAKALH